MLALRKVFALKIQYIIQCLTHTLNHWNYSFPLSTEGHYWACAECARLLYSDAEVTWGREREKRCERKVKTKWTHN